MPEVSTLTAPLRYVKRVGSSTAAMHVGSCKNIPVKWTQLLHYCFMNMHIIDHRTLRNPNPLWYQSPWTSACRKVHNSSNSEIEKLYLHGRLIPQTQKETTDSHNEGRGQNTSINQVSLTLDYPSKYPPHGIMKWQAYHGDCPTVCATFCKIGYSRTGTVHVCLSNFLTASNPHL